MDDRDDQKYEPEAPTIVPGSGAAGPRPPGPVRPSSPASPASAGNDFATIVPTARREAATGVISSPPTRVPSGSLGPAPVSTWGGLLLAPGTVLANRYEIVRILGEGGMGAVYEARDLELERAIALKVIRPELASDPEILQRFKQELVLARQ